MTSRFWASGGSALTLSRGFASVAIGFGGAGTLSAPTLSYPSPLATNPTTIAVHIGADWQSGDVLKLARSASVSMSSPTILTHTLTDADITAGTISLGLSGVTLAGTTYFEALGSHSGVDSANVSNIVTWGDTTAPAITTASTANNVENTALAITLAATDTGGVPAIVSDGTISGWYISGGADRLQYQVAIVGGVPTLQWYNNGTEAYLSPNNYPPNNANPYVVQLTAVDYGGNQSAAQTISVTVLQGAATLTSPSASPAATSANLSVTTNQSTGTLYWVVSTNATPPTSAQVVAGHDSTGGAGAAASSQAVTATGAQSVSATGLSISTAYYAYFCHVNGASQQSTVASVSFTTLAAAASLVVSAGQFSGTFPGTPYTFSTVHLGAGLAHVFIGRDYTRVVTSVVARKTGQTDVSLTKTYNPNTNSDVWTGAIPVDATDWTLIITDGTDTPVSWAIMAVTVVGGLSTPTQTDSETIAAGATSPFTGATNFTIPAGGVAFRFLQTVGTSTTAVALTATDGATALQTFNYTNFDGLKCQLLALQMTANGNVAFSSVPTTPNTPITLVALCYNHS